MAKKIVEVDEELLKGMMTSDIPLYGRDAEERKTVSVPKKEIANGSEGNSAVPFAEKEVTEEPGTRKSRRKKEEPGGYRDSFLINIPSSNRSHVYINREIADSIKRFLPVIAPDMSISGYISNILADHLQRHWDEISELYNDEFHKLVKPL